MTNKKRVVMKPVKEEVHVLHLLKTGTIKLR
jgi:hypothetical protein